MDTGEIPGNSTRLGHWTEVGDQIRDQRHLGDAWTPIEYTHAFFDEQTQRWISVAEVAEIPFAEFPSQK